MSILLRSALVLFVALGTLLASAQRVRGRFMQVPAPSGHVVLFATIGGTLHRVDSVVISPKGNFDLGKRTLEPGFYTLAINDTDRVDLILVPTEPLVELQFTGSPLQEHITVLRSEQNTTLWEYKAISRTHQASLGQVRSERANADPRDSLLLRSLDDRERRIGQIKELELKRITSEHPSSFFSWAVAQDAALMSALPEGWSALRGSVDVSDHRLLRTNIHAKAVLAFLQTSPPERYSATCDSLLAWCASDSLAWCTVRAQLVNLFSTYGPDAVAQHMVDRYLVGSGALWPADAELSRIAEDQLRVAVGAQLPELALPLPLVSDTLVSSAFFTRHTFVLVFFFSSTCGHCHDQMPGLRDLYPEIRQRGGELLGVALDSDLEELRSTVTTEGLTWPIASELLGWGGAISTAFAVKATPSFFLVDSARVIRSKPYDHVEARTAIERLFAEPRPR